MTVPKPVSDPTVAIRRISIWMFIGIVVVYLMIIEGVGLLTAHLADLHDGVPEEWHLFRVTSGVPEPR
jgi:hypothetical protein